VFGYVRGQLLFSLIMGTSAAALLWVLGSLGIFPDGRTYALFFGAWYGFAELIPYVGPAIGAFPPVLIAALGGQPLDAVWLIVGFTALQQLEGHVVAPNVFGQALRINPLLVIFALLLGGQIYGLIGAFISLPLAAILRETVVYFRRHLVFQSWDLPAVTPSVTSPNTAAGGDASATTAMAAPQAGGGGVAGETQITEPKTEPKTEPATRACPECGSAVTPGAAACPACGTELGEAEGEAAATSAAPG
jgi:hypothetical protein